MARKRKSAAELELKTLIKWMEGHHKIAEILYTQYPGLIELLEKEKNNLKIFGYSKALNTLADEYDENDAFSELQSPFQAAIILKTAAEAREFQRGYHVNKAIAEFYEKIHALKNNVKDYGAIAEILKTRLGALRSGVTPMLRVSLRERKRLKLLMRYKAEEARTQAAAKEQGKTKELRKIFLGGRTYVKPIPKKTAGASSKHALEEAERYEKIVSYLHPARE